MFGQQQPQQGSSDIEAITEAALASYGGSGAGGPKVLGGGLGPGGQATGPYAMPENWTGYTDQDVRNILRGLPEEELARIQSRLIAMGKMSKADLGFVDGATEQVFTQVLEYSNDRQQHWRETLLELEKTVRESGDAALDKTPDQVYLPPDYDTLSETVKAHFKDTLRRDPTDAELAMLGDKLSSLYRQEFDASTQALQMEDTGAGRIVQGPTQVDPLASFRAYVDNRYADEIDVVEDVDERQQSTALGGTVLDSLGSIIA